MRLEATCRSQHCLLVMFFSLKQRAAILQNESVDNKLLQALLMPFAFNLCNKLLQDVGSFIEPCVHFCLCSGFRWLKRNSSLLLSKA